MTLTNTLVNLLDDAFGADCVDLAGFDDLEAAVSIILVIAQAAQGGANTCVNVGVVAQKTFLGSVKKVSAV